jgi:hypothetical protein
MNQVTTDFIASNVVNFFFDESLRKGIGGCGTEDGLRAYLKRLVVGEIETAKRMENRTHNV